MSFVKKIINEFKLHTYNKHTNLFVRHNKKHWFKTNTSNSDSEVLFELNNINSAHVPYSYLANVLAEKYNAKITAYAQISKKSFFIKTFRAFVLCQYRVYRSFGVTKFVHPELNSAQLKQSRDIADNIISTLNNVRDVESIEVEGIWIGDLIYDSYLKQFKKPTIRVSENEFRKFLYESICTYVYWRDYFDNHNVKAINVSHCVYTLAIPLRIAVSKGIPAYQINTTHAYRMSKDNVFAYKDSSDFPEMFRSLPINIQDSALEIAKKRIDLRFSGKIGVDMKYSKKTAYGQFKTKRLISESTKVKVLIATHCFFDSPHSFGKNLFSDFYEWLDFLGKMTKETDYDWYIKTHPDYVDGTLEIIKSFIVKYPKFHLLPADSSHHQ